MTWLREERTGCAAAKRMPALPSTVAVQRGYFFFKMTSPRLNMGP